MCGSADPLPRTRLPKAMAARGRSHLAPAMDPSLALNCRNDRFRRLPRGVRTTEIGASCRQASPSKPVQPLLGRYRSSSFRAASGPSAVGLTIGNINSYGPIRRCEMLPLHDHALHAHGARKTRPPCPRTGAISGSWDTISPVLSQVREVNAVDLTGHGQTPEEADSGTFDGLARSLEDWLGAENLTGGCRRRSLNGCAGATHGTRR